MFKMLVWKKENIYDEDWANYQQRFIDTRREGDGRCILIPSAKEWEYEEICSYHNIIEDCFVYA